MTNEKLLTHELTHRLAGNGYAVVQILPSTISTVTETTTEWVYVTDKWCKKGQAFLAARDFMEIHQQAKSDGAGGWLPPAPVKLTDEELAKLAPLRDGLAGGTLKISSTRFEKVSL